MSAQPAFSVLGGPAETLLQPLRGDDDNGLTGVIQRLSQARTLPEIQQIVSAAARRLTGADGASFVLREGDLCSYAEEDAISPLWRGQRFPMSACITGWAMLNRLPAAIPDVYEDDRVPHDVYRQTFVKSLAVVPIRHSDPIGAVGNYWATRHQPTAREIAVLQALADCTAVAIENVRAKERLKLVRQEAMRQVTAAAEEERCRFARELHDQTLQALGGLRILLMRAGRQTDIDVWREAGRTAIGHVEREIENLRAIVTDLRPPALDQLGLVAALEALGEHHGAMTGLTVSCECSAPQGELGPEVEITIYRLVQEALSNVSKHANATSAKVGVDLEGDSIEVVVRDDGVGFDPSLHAAGFGIAGVRERLAFVGGTLSIASGTDGTAIRALIPLAVAQGD